VGLTSNEPSAVVPTSGVLHLDSCDNHLSDVEIDIRGPTSAVQNEGQQGIYVDSTLSVTGNNGSFVASDLTLHHGTNIAIHIAGKIFGKFGIQGLHMNQTGSIDTSIETRIGFYGANDTSGSGVDGGYLNNIHASNYWEDSGDTQSLAIWLNGGVNNLAVHSGYIEQNNSESDIVDRSANDGDSAFVDTGSSLIIS
jgi:hypothetical protein